VQNDVECQFSHFSVVNLEKKEIKIQKKQKKLLLEKKYQFSVRDD